MHVAGGWSAVLSLSSFSAACSESHSAVWSRHPDPSGASVWVCAYLSSGLGSEHQTCLVVRLFTVFSAAPQISDVSYKVTALL